MPQSNCKRGSPHPYARKPAYTASEAPVATSGYSGRSVNPFAAISIRHTGTKSFLSRKLGEVAAPPAP